MPGLGDLLQGGPPPPAPGLGDRLLNQWKASLANRILSAPSKLFGGLVVDPAVEGVTDLVTLAGDVYGGRQPTMSADPQTGEMHTDPRLSERTANAAGMLTLGAGAIPAEANALRMGIKAYHGSPHDFERFDSSKIGTGEGAQAYGSGLYFAENEGVAKQYRETLGRGDKVKVGGKSLDKSKVDYYDQQALNWIRTAVRERPDNAIDLAIEKAAARAARDEAEGATQAAISARKTLERLQDFKAKGVEVENPGRMYEVDIAADPEHFLDWDKPLSQQSPQVKEILKQRNGPFLDAGDLGASWKSPASQYYKFRADVPNSPKGASEKLKDYGIPGIRYLDQGSRVNIANLPKNPMTDEARKWLEAHGNDADAAVKAFHQHQRDTGYKDWNTTERDEIADVIRKSVQRQTSNYVVFDENLISILKKYGLPISAAGLAALSQLHPEEARAGGLGDRLQGAQQQ